jgi:AhpD family alkylhydroperoxidase
MQFNPYKADPAGYEILMGLGRHLTDGPLEVTTRLLVETRVSQISGCAYCLGVHLRQARAAGIAEDKLDRLAAWVGAGDFTERERAALGLAEAMTRIGDGRKVDPATWAAARSQFDDAELAALLVDIGLINLYNRMNVAVQ